MWIKLDGTTIVNHDYSNHDDFNTEVSESILVDLQAPYFGVYRFKYVDGALVELTDEEKKSHPVRVANKMAEIRQERDRRLAECDFITMSDSPASNECKTDFMTYRQELRDLTIDLDVDDFEWPEKPEYVKG